MGDKVSFAIVKWYNSGWPLSRSIHAADASSVARTLARNRRRPSVPLCKAGKVAIVLPAVEQALSEELRWPRRMVQRIEDARRGSGFHWAAERVRNWIEETTPVGWEELLRLIQAAKVVAGAGSDSTALIEESRRIWYFRVNDIYPQRAVARLYEALAARVRGDLAGYVSSLATAVFIAASSEAFTEKMFRDLQESYSVLVIGDENHTAGQDRE